MQHKRILVLGCSGSGKSTFARRLGDVTGLPIVHLDRFFWKPGWVQATREEFYPALVRELVRDAWVIDGNFTTTLPWRLEFCDLVIWFDMPRLLCIWGIISRFFKFRHRIRPDITEACPEKVDREFLKYTWDFKKTHGVRTMEMIRTSGKPCVTFHSRRDARRYLEEAAHDNA